MEILLIVLLLVLSAWTVWGYFSSRVEQAKYAVIKKADGYEIREYPAQLVAQAVVTGSYDDALQQGFRIVAGYIFGGNTKKENISMTAPVTANIEGESHIISFGMPRSYTLATLPTPTDSRVKIMEISARKMAVKRFSMRRTDRRVQLKKQELLQALSRDKIAVIGEPQYAGYNAPWTPPWMMRNEVMVEIK